mgnify:CR=1 FL=1
MRALGVSYCLRRSEDVTTKPEITKKMSTPVKPPLSHSCFIWSANGGRAGDGRLAGGAGGGGLAVGRELEALQRLQIMTPITATALSPSMSAR